MECTETKEGDLKNVVRCHKLAFPGALSTKLGTGFISKMLSWYIESDRGLMFHIEDEEEVVGYVGGILIRTPGLPGAATSITQHSFKAFILAFLMRPWLVFHPENLKRISFISKNIRMKLGLDRKASDQPATVVPESFIPSMGLVVIGVSPKYQGKGFGSVLLKEFEERARRNGFKRINLSVKSSNHQAIAAYKKNGWEIGRGSIDELEMFKNLV